MTKQLPRLIQNLAVSWLTAVTLEYILLPGGQKSLAGLAGIREMSGVRVLCVTALGMLLWNLAPRSRYQRWGLPAVFSLYAAASLRCCFTWPFLGACVLILALLVVYARYGWEQGAFPKGGDAGREGAYKLLTGILAAVFFFFVSGWTVARVRSFCAPTYDFGIFSQMFYSMRETGLPMTTLERDGLLSHFAVHMSPIYYLMLPAFCLAPIPETLQILQAAVISSAVIPLWKLGKTHGLHPGLRMLSCLLLLVYPAYAGGTGYDLHENCFLTPLILWLFWGIDRKNIPATAASAVLTLMVKEDAAVYAAVIGLYLLLRSALRRESWGLWTGGVLTAGAVAWFLGVTFYLAGSGDGVMTYRYQNFMYDGSGSLVSVIKAVLLCPMKAVFECVDEEKLGYIGLTLLPLLGLPLITRRYENLVLLIPYLLVNLMSDYRYQHDILYQYSFGSVGFFMYLAIRHVADLKGQWRRFLILGMAAVLSFACFCREILPVAAKYISYTIRYEARYDRQREILDTIPADAPTAATTFLTACLSDRPVLYDIRYSSREHILSCEYVVIKVSDTGSFRNYEEEGERGRENFVDMLLEQGYRLEQGLEGDLRIYRKGTHRGIGDQG